MAALADPYAPTGVARAADPSACCPRCVLEREWLRIRRSPLLAAGGFAVYEGLLDDATARALLREAFAREGRRDQVAPDEDREQVRGGAPPRSLASVDGGLLLAALYTAPELLRFVAGAVAMAVRPCGAQASYSIYNGAGAGLGLHRDVRGCDLTLIACLHDTDPGGEGGCTEAWPHDLTTPLDDLRAGGGHGSVTLGLWPGQCMLLHGGIVPHRIRAIGSGRQRIVALMCYEIVG
jgi:hypothetical protein